MHQSNVPKLRFNPFDFDNFEWKLNSINTLIENKTLQKPLDGNHGNIHPKAKDFIKNGIPFLMANNISNNSIDFINCHKISKTQADSLQKGFSYEGDLLLTHKGSVGNLAIVPKSEYPYVMLSPQVTFYRVQNKRKLNNKFLYLYFQTSNFKKQLKILSIGATRAYIGITEQRKLLIRLPDIVEQKKIASFLSAIDLKIEKLTRKKELLEDYKKGVMQKLFSGEIRFKDENGNDYPDWEEVKLGDVASIVMGQSPDSKSYNQSGEGMPLIQGNADIINRVSSPRQWTSLPTKTCFKNDLIMTVRAPVGSISKSIHNACIGRGVCLIRSNDKSNLEYLYQFLLNFESKWVKLEQGSTFSAVSGKEIKSIKLKLPAILEQRKISTFLSSIDSKIENISLQIENTKKFKNGLLQQMFV